MAEHPEKIVVIGSGVMGRGIAHVAAMSGHHTTMVDREQTILDAAMNQVRANLDKGVSLGKVSEEARETTLENLRTATDYVEPSRDAALVVEAVPEVMDLKREIFQTLGEVSPDSCILATNTSSLSVTEIANAAHRPERVIGAHFFNPVHVRVLLEIVMAQQTSEDTLAGLKRLGARMSREMIVVQDTPGFATSRLGLALGLEAIRMVEAGVASAEDIDRGMQLGYVHPMGPLKLTDWVGLDTRLKIAEYLYQELGTDTFRPPALLRQMVEEGKLGRKSGQGFYTW